MWSRARLNCWVSARLHNQREIVAGGDPVGYRAGMLDFITYDFGYSWSVRYAMIAPLIVAGSLAALAAWRSWSST